MLSADLHPHQSEGVAWLLRPAQGRSVSLLGDPPGVGKTPQAIGLIAALVSQDPAARVLLAVPRSLVKQWTSELERFAPALRVTAYGSKGAATAHVVLASHGLLGTRTAELAAGNWAAVIVDEVSAVGKATVAAAWPPMLVWPKALAGLASVAAQAPRAVGLTATAAENSPAETWAIMRALGLPGLPSWAEFRAWLHWSPYVPPGGRGQSPLPPKVLGYSAGGAQRLGALLDTCTLRRTAADIPGLALPVRVGQEIEWVALTAAQRQAYRQSVGVRGLPGFQARQKASRLHAGETALADAAVSWLLARDDQNEKALAYCENLPCLDALSERLDSSGISWVRIDGASSLGQRKDALAWHADPDGPRVLIGSSVLERGLNAQHARVLLSLDSSFNPGREAQREGRIRRIGSPHADYEHVVFVPDTPDARSKYATLRRKHNLAAAVGLA